MYSCVNPFFFFFLKWSHSLTPLFNRMMGSGSRVCLGRGLYICTKTPESRQYNATMAATAFQHLHVRTCAQAYLRVTVGNPLSHKLINAASRASEWLHACTNLHVCSFGDQMSGHGSNITPSVALWFCSLAECYKISTEDFHLCIPNKSIKHQREVICEIKLLFFCTDCRQLPIFAGGTFAWMLACVRNEDLLVPSAGTFLIVLFFVCQNMNFWPGKLFLPHLLTV